MDESSTNQVRDSLKQWISLDDEERQLREQIKTLKQHKTDLSQNILEFMRNNQVDNFSLEGNGVGNITRSVRTSRPPLRRKFYAHNFCFILPINRKRLVNSCGLSKVFLTEQIICLLGEHSVNYLCGVFRVSVLR